MSRRTEKSRLLDTLRKKGKYFMPKNCLQVWSRAWSTLATMYRSRKKGKCVMPISCSQESLMRVSMYIFTEWPWETVSETIKHITNRPADVEQERSVDNVESAVQLAMQANVEQAQQAVGQPQRCSATCFLKWLVITLLRFSFILAGMSLQLMTCFRRDPISNDLEQIPGNNTKLLICDNENEISCILFFRDIQILLLAFWIYVVLKFSHHIYKYCSWLERGEINTIMEANTAANLNELVEAVRPKLSKRLIVVYTVIPLCYIILSQLVSVGCLFAFQLVNEDFVMQTPLGGHDLAGDLKQWFITLIFVGFVAKDLLYITLEMRYVYRCQMITYYLQLMQHKAIRQEYKYMEYIKEVSTACNFIKYLNASNGTGCIIFVAVFRVGTCALILLDDEITYPEAAAIAARLILWGFLALYPFHKAAGLNAVIKELRDTNPATEIPPWVLVLFGIPQDQENGLRRRHRFSIALKATMFGITVPLWSPYLVICSMLLTIMIRTMIGVQETLTHCKINAFLYSNM